MNRLQRIINEELVNVLCRRQLNEIDGDFGFDDFGADDFGDSHPTNPQGNNIGVTTTVVDENNYPSKNDVCIPGQEIDVESLNGDLPSVVMRKLEDGICYFAYVKRTDGSYRTAVGTKNREILNRILGEYDGAGNRNWNRDYVFYYDFDARNFRRYDPQNLQAVWETPTVSEQTDDYEMMDDGEQQPNANPQPQRHTTSIYGSILAPANIGQTEYDPGLTPYINARFTGRNVAYEASQFGPGESKEPMFEFLCRKMSDDKCCFTIATDDGEYNTVGTLNRDVIRQLSHNPNWDYRDIGEEDNSESTWYYDLLLQAERRFYDADLLRVYRD